MLLSQAKQLPRWRDQLSFLPKALLPRGYKVLSIFPADV